MKRFLTLMMVLILALSVVSCKKNDSDSPANNGANSKKAEEYIKQQAEEKGTEENAQNESPLPSADMPEVKNENDMKTFLAEYEAWADKYIEAVNNYRNNPSDKDILLEYAKMMQQSTEWNKKLEDYVIELGATPEILEEYTNAVSKITVKISEGVAQ